MEVQELRFGNYVFNPIQNKIVKANMRIFAAIFSDDIVHAPDEMRFQPVIITEELLLKMGAHKSNNEPNQCWLSITNIKAELFFDFYHDEIVVTLKSDYSDLILDPIKYIHKLQNLYYVLSNGEELNM